MARTWDLNFFLLESTVHDAKDALATGKDLKHRTIKDGLGFTGTLFFKLGDEHEPTWADLVSAHLKGKTDFFPSTQSISAVLFVRTANGHYAYSFGIGGRSLLRRDACVPDFGKKVVLSIVDPKKLRSMDLRTMRDQPFLTRQHATRGAQLRSFGVDTLQDHLRAVTGEPLAQHSGLATRVTGADSLSYRAKLEFTDLGSRSDSFLTAFNSNAYKNVADFKWVDQVTVVRAPQLISVLDGLMLDLVKQQTFDLSPLDMVDWANAPTFSFGENVPEEERLEFISASDLVAHFGHNALNGLTINQLKDTAIYCFYGNDVNHSERWSAYDCIELDLVHNGIQYTFGAGRWSLVEPNFLQTVNDFVNALKVNAPVLPIAVLAQDGNAKGDKIDEAKYIVRICNGNANYAKIHKCGHDVSFGGNVVELCDVYDVNRNFIHLKVWSSSQTFSALAMQGTNASEFLTDNQFVRDSRGLIQHVKPQFAGALPDDFQPRDYRVVFGLIRRQAGTIPFFSRLTLMRAAQRVRNHFFQVAFVQIPVQ